jgi:hypothetical protein
VDGIELGAGDGINEGLCEGEGVEGESVGDVVGRFVGLHVVHESRKVLGVPDASPNSKTSHDIVDSGGVLLMSPSTNPRNAAVRLSSPAINQLFPCSAS